MLSIIFFCGAWGEVVLEMFYKVWVVCLSNKFSNSNFLLPHESNIITIVYFTSFLRKVQCDIFMFDN